MTEESTQGQSGKAQDSLSNLKQGPTVLCFCGMGAAGSRFCWELAAGSPGLFWNKPHQLLIKKSELTQANQILSD